MPSSTFQVLHSRCAAVPITAYVINHHKTYDKTLDNGKQKTSQLKGLTQSPANHLGHGGGHRGGDGRGLWGIKCSFLALEGVWLQVVWVMAGSALHCV